MNGVFITGTDTGVGKTVVACALTRALTRAGHAVAVRKPVESGCARRAGQLEPADGTALARAAGHRETLETVTPMRLAHALSPERAAYLEGMQLTLYDLIAAARIGNESDFFVVEGAGGFLSPLASNALNADLALALGLPVLVVAEDRLGSINHTLLTAEAIERRGLRLAGIVLNAREAEAGKDMANRDDLLSRLGGHVIPFPYGREDRETADMIAEIVTRDFEPTS